MSTGDQSDMLARLKALLPDTWFPSTSPGQATNSPVLDGILSGGAALWAQSYALLYFVANQTRMATATGVFLDMIAGDFFGSLLSRLAGETDAALLARIDKELFRPKGTRPALVQALTDLTGQKPVVFEPTNTGDTGGYNQGGIAYGLAGGYGSLLLPFQFFVTAVRPSGGGVANVDGYNGYLGGYGTGAIEYATLSMASAPVTDAHILAEINDVRPVATIAWTNLVSSLTPPSAPGTVLGLTATPTTGAAGSITLSWSAASGATAYDVLERLTGATAWNFSAAGASTSATVTGLTGGTGYDFSVYATNSAGPGNLSATASGTPYSLALTFGTLDSANWPPNTPVSHTGAWANGGLNFHANAAPPSGATGWLGYSTSNTVPPTTGLISAGLFNTADFGAYCSPPASAGTWYVWALVHSSSGSIIGAQVSSAITVT